MGNACCSQGTDHRIYDPINKQVLDLNPSLSRIESIKFPLANIPNRHPIVQELNNQAGNFRSKYRMSIVSSGMPSQPRLLNKEGLIYHGEWANGIPHGKGQLYYPNGAYYVGYLCKGNADGQGRFISPDDWIFEGELQNEQAQGRGFLYHRQLRYKYNGEWSGDLPNGLGHEQWHSKKIVYDGQFLNGKKHGEGKYVTPQFEYSGTFNNDEFDSYGFLNYHNGQKYQGNFSKGKRDGKGIYMWSDGSYYDGFYRNDLKHGKGKYKNGESEWQGDWQDGKRKGNGILVVNNKIYSAQWYNGVPHRKDNYNKTSQFLALETSFK